MTVSEITCERIIAGCPDCLQEYEFELSQGHECGPSDPRRLFITSCEMFGQMKRSDEATHRAMHKPVTCHNRRCRAVLNDRMSPRREVARLCRRGYCIEWCCPECGTVQSSDGPVACPKCGWGRDPKLTRMRSAYRGRRRYW